MLVNFKRSDCTLSCVQMERKALGTGVFQNYAARKLVLLESIFPQNASLLPKQSAGDHRLDRGGDQTGAFGLAANFPALGQMSRSSQAAQSGLRA